MFQSAGLQEIHLNASSTTVLGMQTWCSVEAKACGDLLGYIPYIHILSYVTYLTCSDVLALASQIQVSTNCPLVRPNPWRSFRPSSAPNYSKSNKDVHCLVFYLALVLSSLLLFFIAVVVSCGFSPESVKCQRRLLTS